MIILGQPVIAISIYYRCLITYSSHLDLFWTKASLFDKALVRFDFNEENLHIYRYLFLEYGGIDTELYWYGSELFPDTVV